MQNQTQTAYDPKATEIVLRNIESDAEAEEILTGCIKLAYDDALHFPRGNYPGEFSDPRKDAADAIREYLDEHNPIFEQPSIYTSLIDYAFDRCDFGEIVDHLRRRMQEQESEDTFRCDYCGAIHRPSL